ncbi:MAG: serine hydroxymethyltransferase [Selenomonadaceae bacterium]|nr:serine hydroxymethyltransferase [Selenomonadaceae bacterium]
MDNDKILRNLKVFDPPLWEALNKSLTRQLKTLSLIPTTNATSPFASFLKGSVLGNDFLDHHAAEQYGLLEEMAMDRACELFHAESAIVRLGNPVAASRVVFFALASTGDTILSFNRRKEEYCTGTQMEYNFVNFGVDPNTFFLDMEKLGQLARLNRPKIIIYSPVNYPFNIDYPELARVAKEVGAKLWVDMGQNAGLIAAGKIPSPVPYADVVTFCAGDALHGPQNGIILCKNELAALLDKTVIETGHVSLKKNVLAALNMVFKEAACPEYGDYAEEVLANALALEKGLKQGGAKIICSPTQNHLVLARLAPEQDGEAVAAKLKEAGLLVKAETLLTADERVSYPILRLSSLDATTRGLEPEEMRRVGAALAEFLASPQDSAAVEKIAKVVKKLVAGRPLFSVDWLPEAEFPEDDYGELMVKAMVHGYA